MISDLRQHFNNSFSADVYDRYLKELESLFPGHLDFRIAETPAFIPRWFSDQMLQTCEAMIDVITAPDYLKQTERAIPPQFYVPNEDQHPQFIAFDFGICEIEDGKLEPQLIELQAFPTLFAWHALMPETFSKHFSVPANFSPYLNGFHKEEYLRLLKEIILGYEAPQHVVLLEI
ncbi:MAG TPA: hypothetical protein VEZ55_17620, partial [Chitinophagaceae bacterium]|nr:hypothetical protein [Chitinophagaceae bacterium]